MQVMERFVKDLSAYGQAVEVPKLVGRNLHVMLTPLPRNKRAKNPSQVESGAAPRPDTRPAERLTPPDADGEIIDFPAPDGAAGESEPSGFTNNPFAQLSARSEEESGS